MLMTFPSFQVKMENGNPVVRTRIELDRQIDEMIEKKDGIWKCNVCEIHVNVETKVFQQGSL